MNSSCQLRRPWVSCNSCLILVSLAWLFGISKCISNGTRCLCWATELYLPSPSNTMGILILKSDVGTYRADKVKCLQFKLTPNQAYSFSCSGNHWYASCYCGSGADVEDTLSKGYIHSHCAIWSENPVRAVYRHHIPCEEMRRKPILLKISQVCTHTSSQ